MITKDELMKMAEPGVRAELEAMQARLNELARLFPHIVKNQDGSVPAVLPIVQKKASRQAAAGRPKRRPIEESIAILRKFLQTKPGAATSEVMVALGGVVRTHAAKILRAAGAKEVGKRPPRGSTQEIHWRL